MPPSPPRAARRTGCVRLFSWKTSLKSSGAHFTQCRHPEPLAEVHLISVESERTDTERPTPTPTPAQEMLAMCTQANDNMSESVEKERLG